MGLFKNKFIFSWNLLCFWPGKSPVWMQLFTYYLYLSFDKLLFCAWIWPHPSLCQSQLQLRSLKGWITGPLCLNEWCWLSGTTAVEDLNWSSLWNFQQCPVDQWLATKILVESLCSEFRLGLCHIPALQLWPAPQILSLVPCLSEQDNNRTYFVGVLWGLRVSICKALYIMPDV